MKEQKVQIKISERVITGTVTGTATANSHCASERGVKLFVIAEGVEYQCWQEGEQPYSARRSAIQPK